MNNLYLENFYFFPCLEKNLICCKNTQRSVLILNDRKELRFKRDKRAFFVFLT